MRLYSRNDMCYFAHRNETTLFEMIRLTHLFLSHPDNSDFTQWLNESYLPLVRELPGVIRMEIARVSRLPLGQTKVQLFIEQYFPSEDGMNAALSSVQGRKLSRVIMDNPSLAPELLVSEVEDGFRAIQLAHE